MGNVCLMRIQKILQAKEERKISTSHYHHCQDPETCGDSIRTHKGTVSVQFSCSVVSDSLWPHGLLHNRSPCPSQTNGVFSSSCPLSQWCHPTISSSVVPFSSQTFTFSISPSNEYSGLISFRMDWLDLLAFQDTLKSLLQHHSSKASILQHSAFFIVQCSLSIHGYWKNHSLD